MIYIDPEWLFRFLSLSEKASSFSRIEGMIPFEQLIFSLLQKVVDMLLSEI
jgi:hypothetical protein